MLMRPSKFHKRVFIKECSRECLLDLTSYSDVCCLLFQIALQQVNFMQCVVDLGNTTLSHRALKNLELFDTKFENYNPKWFEKLKVEKVSLIHNSICANLL